MNDVERWLQRQAAREQRGVLLEEALLADRLWRYTRYRLRYFFARYAVETAVHTVTVLFLVRELAWRSFLPIILTSAATSLAASFWWGALEGLRSHVRDLHRSGKPHRIARVIGGWLTMALGISVAVVCLAVAWVVWRGTVGGIDAADAYVAVLLLRLAADVPVRCYHSGVYALRRVYKPLAATLMPQILELAVLLLLWPVAGLWALVVASLVVTSAVTAVNLRYTARVYHFIGLSPLGDLGRRSLRHAFLGVGREPFQAGMANAVIALDSLVVLALLYTAAAGSEALVVLFLVAPSIRAGADWARLFYFDLKRLELRLFTNLRARFERHTWKLAWLLGLLLWCLAVAVATAFYGRSLGSLYVALVPFFTARSLLARVQVQAFAEAAYVPVVTTGVVLLGGLAAGATIGDGETQRVAAAAIATVIAATCLSLLRRRARERGDPGSALLTLEWLRRLGEVREPVLVASARVLPVEGKGDLDSRGREERTRWRLGQLAERTARRLGERGAAAWVGPDRLVWFEVAGDERQVSAHWLQVASGGLIGDITDRWCPSGEEALLAAGQHQLLGPASSHLLAPILPVDLTAARQAFERLLPGGIVYSPEERAAASLAALPRPELRAILVDAVAFARDLRVGRRRSRFDVTALCAGGELRLIFVADLRTSKRARARWHDQVVRRNIHGAVGGARAARAAARLPSVTSTLSVPARLRTRRVHVPPDLVGALARVPLLSELRGEELRRVAAAMTERSFTAGDEITREGEPGVGFFVIVEGDAMVAVHGRFARRLGPGDHFGEIALIAESPRTATVTATTDLRCYKMTSWEFRRLIEANASISWHVLQSTARLLSPDWDTAVAELPTSNGTRRYSRT